MSDYCVLKFTSYFILNSLKTKLDNEHGFREFLDMNWDNYRATHMHNAD